MLKIRLDRWLPALVLALVATSCTYKSETREESFALSRYSVAFASGGGETAVTVAAPQTWSAETDAAWIVLNCAESTLTVTALENDETAGVRTADITVISSTGGTLTLEALQEPAAPVRLEVACGTAEHVIDSEGGTFTVSVSSNYDWTATLEPEVDGWTVDAGHEWTACVRAAANTGDSVKTAELVIRAGCGEVAVEERVEVTQISRAENGYYRCVGKWNVYADNWYLGSAEVGESGTFDSCSIAEYSYANSLLSVIGLGLSNDVQTDRLQYNGKDNTLVWPVGYLVGTTRASNGYAYYLYIVALNMSGGFTTCDLECTISDDGQTISIDEMPENYPILGVIGYNGYLGYALWTNVYYPEGSIQFRKDSSSSLSLFAESSVGVEPVTGPLPDGIPSRLSSGTIGDSISVIK